MRFAIRVVGLLLVLSPGAAYSQAPSNISLGTVQSDFVPISWVNHAPYDSIDILADGMVVGAVAGQDTSYDWDIFAVTAGQYSISLVATLAGVPLPAVVGPTTTHLCPGLYGAVPPANFPPGYPVPNDPLFFDQWSLHNYGQLGPKDVDIDVMQAWTIETGCADVIVATVEIGTDWTHPDLQNRLTPGYNFETRQPDPGGYDPTATNPVWDPTQYVPGSPYAAQTQDESYHNMAVHGIIAAERNNGIGIAGIAGGTNPSDGVRIMPFMPALNPPAPFPNLTPHEYCGAWTGVGALANYVADVLEYCVYLKVNFGAPIRVVTSESSGTYNGCQDTQDRVENAIVLARANGILFLQAAGNSGPGNVSDLATHPLAIAVSNSTRDGTLNDSSATGPEIDISAPGSQIMTLDTVGEGDPAIDPSGNYQSGGVCGTSFSTPHVAATAALLFSFDPTLTADDVAQLLFDSADDLGPPGKDDSYGWGRVNAYRALLLADTTIPDVPGDVNGDGAVNIADPIALLLYLFQSQTPGSPICALDFDESGSTDIADAIFLLGYLHNDGAEPLIGCASAPSGCP